jgi:hypothetical protein
MRSELLEQAREYGSTALTSAEEYGESALETVEDTVAGIPANALLTAGFASIGVALALKLSGRDRDAKFVGQWAPTFIGLAVFSKLAKHAKQTRRKS